MNSYSTMISIMKRDSHDQFHNVKQRMLKLEDL